MAKTRKVDPKMVEKEKISKIITAALEAEGYRAEDGTEYGFTKTSILASGETYDVQVKLITPNTKTGNRYPILPDEEEDETVVVED